MSTPLTPSPRPWTGVCVPPFAGSVPQVSTGTQVYLAEETRTGYPYLGRRTKPGTALTDPAECGTTPESGSEYPG